MSEQLEKTYIKHALSFQERDLVIQLAKLLPDGEVNFMIKDVRDEVSIEQHSHFSAIVTRLVQKELLIRVRRGQYRFQTIGLVEYLRGME